MMSWLCCYSLVVECLPLWWIISVTTTTIIPENASTSLSPQQIYTFYQGKRSTRISRAYESSLSSLSTILMKPHEDVNQHAVSKRDHTALSAQPAKGVQRLRGMHHRLSGILTGQSTTSNQLGCSRQLWYTTPCRRFDAAPDMLTPMHSS